MGFIITVLSPFICVWKFSTIKSFQKLKPFFLQCALAALSSLILGSSSPALLRREHSLLASEMAALLILLICLQFSKPLGLLLLLPSLLALLLNKGFQGPVSHQSPFLSPRHSLSWLTLAAETHFSEAPRTARFVQDIFSALATFVDTVDTLLSLGSLLLLFFLLKKKKFASFNF